LQNQGEEVSQG